MWKLKYLSFTKATFLLKIKILKTINKYARNNQNLKFNYNSKKFLIILLKAKLKDVWGRNLEKNTKITKN